jgi:tetratricopeptide (TPR) repeat protein
MGKSFYWRGEYLRSVQSFRDLETNFPASEFFDEARYWRAQGLEAQRIYNQAQKLYRTLVEEAEEEIAVRAGLRLGEMAFEREDYVAAIQEFRTVLEAFPASGDRAQLWLRLAEAQMALQDEARLGDALQSFRNVLQADPNPDQEYRARLNSGRALYALGEEEEALETYVELLKEGRFRNFEGRTRLLIGESYQERRLLEQALDEYGQVRDDFPTTPSSAMALYRTGLLHLQEYGDTELAREYFQETNSESPGSQGVLLAQEMLTYLGRLQQLQARVHRADSLYADSLGAIQGPLVWSEGWVPAEVDSTTKDEIVVARNIEVLDDLFSACEIYRDDIGQADSAIAYYQEVIRRFPESDQLPRAVFSIAWIYREIGNDESAAGPYLARLIEDFPASAQANEARYLLGEEARVTAEELAATEFERIERLRLQEPENIYAYAPLLDSLSQAFSGTVTGARAAFLAATSYENIVGDTLEAERRYRLLGEEYAETEFGKLAIERKRVREEGLIAKLERSLKSVGGQFGPGERIELLALEPDTLDSVSLARKHLGFAQRAQRRGDIKMARDFYEQSIDEQFNNPRSLYQLGNIAWEEGYSDDAIEFYRQALAFDKANLSLYYRLWKVFTVAAEEDSANHYLREVVRRDRGSPQIRFLQEEFPDFYAAEDQEDLDLEQLEGLALMMPEDKIEWQEKDMPLSDWPLVRELVRPVYPVGGFDSTEVLLDVLIDREGRPESVEVFRGEEPFASNAVAAAYDYVFYPAVRNNGVEIKAWVELTVPFGPQSGEDSARAPRVDSEAEVNGGIDMAAGETSSIADATDGASLEGALIDGGGIGDAEGRADFAPADSSRIDGDAAGGAVVEEGEGI